LRQAPRSQPGELGRDAAFANADQLGQLREACARLLGHRGEQFGVGCGAAVAMI
jgi:hypothetical protein